MLRQHAVCRSGKWGQVNNSLSYQVFMFFQIRFGAGTTIDGAISNYVFISSSWENYYDLKITVCHSWPAVIWNTSICTETRHSSWKLQVWAARCLQITALLQSSQNYFTEFITSIVCCSCNSFFGISRIRWFTLSVQLMVIDSAYAQSNRSQG